jgi:coenzyme F420-reducing hydrogenase delta subunit
MIRRTATIHLFYCANSVTETELEGLQTQLDTDGLKTLSLPCSGKATIPYLLKAFEKGADGVVLCTCPESQCKHLEGNLRASKRAEAVEGLLEEIGFGKGRVVVVTKEQGQIAKLIDGIQRLQAVCSVPVRASKETPYGVTTSEPARAVLASARTGNRRENAA